MSHGDTSSVAKLAFESTTLPLWVVGCCIAPDSCNLDCSALGLIRDAVLEMRGTSALAEPWAGDNLILFLEYPGLVSWYEAKSWLEKASEASLSELDGVDERRIGAGIGAGILGKLNATSIIFGLTPDVQCRIFQVQSVCGTVSLTSRP